MHSGSLLASGEGGSLLFCMAFDGELDKVVDQLFVGRPEASQSFGYIADGGEAGKRVDDSGFLVVEPEFLLAGNGLAVAVGWIEGPLANGCDDRFIDGPLDALDELEVGDASVLVDGDVEDNVSFGSAGQACEVGLRAREVFGERDADVA